MHNPATVLPSMRSLIRDAEHRLRAAGCDEARRNAELLLDHVLGIADASLRVVRPLSPEELERFRSLLHRRAMREPLQYITGSCEFMGHTLAVNRGVLIPRPETEVLAERAMAILSAGATPRPAVLDVGTGSGNIAVALAARLPDAEITAVDLSPEALAVAASNIRRHVPGRVELIEADVFGDLLPGRTFDLIVANPPYVAAEEFPRLQPEIVRFEPRRAVTDDGDGLRFHRRLAGIAGRLRPGGALCVEIGFGQRDPVEELFLAGGLTDVRVTADLEGIPRIVDGRRL